MSDFQFSQDDNDDEPEPKRKRLSPASSPVAKWLGTMTAVFVGSLVAGLILLACVRFYVRESIRDTFQKTNFPVDNRTLNK